MVVALLRGAAMLAVAGATVGLLSLFWASAAQQHAVWSLGIAASLVVPPFSAVLPAWRVSVAGLPSLSHLVVAPPMDVASAEGNSETPRAVEEVAITASPDSALVEADRSAVDGVVTVSEASIADTHRARRSWLFWGWVGGAGLLMMRLLLALASLWRLSRSARTITSGCLFEELQQCQREMGIGRQVALLTTTERSMPMTWGLRRVYIVLPSASEAWPPTRVRTVLLHELAHVRRGDFLTQLLSQVVRALQWPNPLIWLAERQMRALQEQACDDRVLGRGLVAANYAEDLLAVVAECAAASATAPALAFARRSQLERRVRGILETKRSRLPVSGQLLAGATVMTVAFAAALATLQLDGASAIGQEKAKQAAAQPPSPANPATADDAKSLAELRTKIRQQHIAPVEDSQLTLGALKGILSALNDPYADYLPAESVAEFEKQVAGSLVGIGVQLETHEKKIRVVTPLAGSPAHKAGIQAGDALLEVDGQAVTGMGLSDVVKRIAGPSGTSVKLKIERAAEQPRDVSVTRGSISLPTVRGFRRAADQEWSFMLDAQHGIGYLHVTQFGGATVSELQAALAELQKRELRGLILDLRFCHGGMLDAAVGCASLLLKRGTAVVTVQGRGGESKTLAVEGTPALGSTPLVVVVNGQTASAAEVFAGALQDNGRGVVIGTRTFGKGSVQSLIRLEDGGAIKLTTAEYRLPTGRNIDKRAGGATWGIDPDDGFFVPVDVEQEKKLLDKRREREIVRLAENGKAAANVEITARTLEQDEADPQLAAALKALIGRLQSGQFSKVSEFTPVQIAQWHRRRDIEERRSTAARTLEQLDRELADLQSNSAKN